MGTIIIHSSQYKQPSHKELGLPAGAYVPELKQTQSNLREHLGTSHPVSHPGHCVIPFSLVNFKVLVYKHVTSKPL